MTRPAASGGILIILGGLPGSGKTTIAREVAKRLGAIHLRIDTIENALVRSGEVTAPVQGAGYVVAYDLAADNLRLGHDVIADSVNSIELTRTAWRDVARKTDAKAIEVEIVCADPVVHRHRLESRHDDIEGMPPVNWARVMAREYQPWTSAALRLDTAIFGIEDCAAQIIEACRA